MVMHFLWVLHFNWLGFDPNILHLIPSSSHIKLRTWSSLNSILDFVCAVKISWISPINASFSFQALELVIGPRGISKTSFGLFICASAWGWLNFSSWFLSFQHLNFYIHEVGTPCFFSSMRIQNLVFYIHEVGIPYFFHPWGFNTLYF